MPNQTKQEKGSIFREKKWVIPLIAVLCLGIVAFIAVNRISSVAEQQLLGFANQQLAPNAQVEIDNLTLGLLPMRIELEGIRLVHAAPFEDQVPLKPVDTIRQFEVKKAELRGLSLFKFITGNGWNFGSLSVDGLQLAIVPTSDDRLTDSAPIHDSPGITISEVKINNAMLSTYPERDSPEVNYLAEGINLNIFNVDVQEPNKPLYSYFEDFSFEVLSLYHKSDDDLYSFLGQNIRVDSIEKTVEIEYFQALPLLNALEISAETGFALDVYNIVGGPYRIENFEISTWLESGDIIAGYATFEGLEIIINREKSYPRRPRENRMLINQKFKELPFTVHVDSVLWSDGVVSYSEQFSDLNRKGTLTFSDLNLNIKSLQNRSETEVIPVSATTKFMDKADLSIDFEFYASARANHTVNATLGYMDLKDVNSVLEPLVYMRAADGALSSLVVTFTADDDRATGELQMIYNNLDLRFLNEASMDESRSTRVRSFFANQIAIRSSNGGDEPRVSPVEFEREKDRSIFNYWWQSIRSGLMETVKR